jgi:hypothetical protein
VQHCVRQLLDHTSLFYSAMPSLRRTISSPSVRSSPYPASLSNANTHGLAAGRSQRRSSGTDTSGRRVLADIEWWRVADGQRDIDTAPESEEHDRDQGQEQGQVVEELSGSAGVPSSDAGAERPSTPFAGTSYNTSSHEVYIVFSRSHGAHGITGLILLLARSCPYCPPPNSQLCLLPPTRPYGDAIHWSHRPLH